jgi:mycothiol synthase
VTVEIKVVSGMAQLEVWVDVHNEICPDDPESAEMMALIRAHQTDHLNLLAYVDGEPVGTAMLSADPAAEAGRSWMEVNVLPAYRGRGIGGELVRAVAEDALRRGVIGLGCEVRTDDASSLAFYERRGFDETKRYGQYVLDLAARAGDEPAVPDGVELTWLADSPSLLAGMHAVAAVFYPEIGGFMARHAATFVQWQVYELGDPAALLDLTPIAVADGEVIGFATMRALLDGTTGELRTVGVLPEWRRQGVATALRGAQVARARVAGLGRLLVWARDPGPHGLYSRLGFGRSSGAIVLEGRAAEALRARPGSLARVPE